MNSSNLQGSAAPFARLTEISDFAYDIAASIEDVMAKRSIVMPIPLAEMARIIDTDLIAFNKRYEAMETALAACCQTALIHGASEEEMRVLGDIVEKGGK